MKLITQDYHRNGISGTGFHVAIFEDDSNKGARMVGIVLPRECDEAYGLINCFVFDLDKLATGDIAFGSNSWRGDRYAAGLRELIENDEERKQEHGIRRA